MAGKDLGVNAKFGLDGTGFQEGIGKINQELKVIKAEFKEAGSRVADFGNSSEKISLLTKQIEIQKQAVATLDAAYAKSVQAKGEDAKATQALRIKLLDAKTALNNMDNELKKTNADAEKGPGLWSKFGKGAEGASKQAISHILNLKNALIGITATAAGGAGLFAFTQSAIEAGDATYKLSQKLHVSTQEAAQVSKMLKVTDTDSTAFTSTLTRLDKGIEGAGKKGNATTKALAEFGVSLTDAHGKLLPMPDQMDKLAAAYQNAADKGEEEAFSATVLGNKGQALIPMLADYASAKEKASQITSIGIDPKEAHEAEQNLIKLKMQVGQLTGAFAKALVPVVTAVLPPLIEGFQKLSQVVKDHKAEIDKAVQSFIKMGKDIGATVVPVIKDVFKFITEHGTLVKNTVIGIGVAFVALKTVSAVIGGITAAQKLWTDATVAYAIVMNGVTKAQEICAGVTKALAGVQAALNVVLAANPIGIVIIAIAALTAGFILLYNHNKAFHDFVINSWKVISSSVASAVSTVQGFISSLGATFQRLPAEAAGWGKDFIQGFLDGIKNMIGSLGKTITDVANTIKSFLHFSTPDQGPLADYETWMPDFMQGMAEGIKKSKHVVTDAINGLSGEMKVNATASLSGTGSNKGSVTTNNKKVEQHLHIQNLHILSQGDQNKTLQQLQFMAPIM